MKKVFALALGLSFVLAAAGCSDGFNTDSSLTKHQWPIINGSRVGMHSPYDAVVSIHDNSKQGISIGPFCSGTLITQDVVLTAAHCMAREKPSGIAIYFGDSPVEAYYANELTIDDFHMASDIEVHPDYNSRQITNDIALIRLQAPVAGITPVPALPAAGGFADGETGTALDFTGFGVDESGNSAVKLHFVGELHHLQGDHQIYYYQPDGGPCSGDSGGPAFVNKNGIHVAGITSYGDAACASYGVSTRVDAFESFISDFTGTVPGPECEVDGDCADGFICSAGSCVEDPGDPGPGLCGDGICDLAGGEDCGNCIDDCVTGPVHKGACCGDGTCYRKESAAQCPADC